MKTKIVKDYNISYNKSGIVILIFNTYERWIDFHVLNNYEYEFYIGEPYGEEGIITVEEKIKVSELKLQGSYVQTVQQNENQIIFYFIPVDLLI